MGLYIEILCKKNIKNRGKLFHKFGVNFLSFTKTLKEIELKLII